MSIFSKLHNIAKTYMQVSRKELEKYDLTLNQAKVLSVLVSNENKMIQRELGEKTYLKPASMSRMIDTLVEKELVERDMNPKSRRSYKIGITKKGIEVYKQAKTIFKNTEKSLFSHLSEDELDEFVRLVTKISEENMHAKTI